MNDVVKNPEIYATKEKFIIMASRQSLITLGELLIMKGKLGKNMSATMKDGISKDIEIRIPEDYVTND